MSDLYSLVDSWTTSSAERLRNTYREKVRQVEDDVANLYAVLASVPSANRLETYRDTGDPSTGRVVTDFEAALDRLEAMVDGLVYRMTLAVRELDEKLVLMRSHLAVLEDLCVSEDAREREYTDAELPY